MKEYYLFENQNRGNNEIFAMDFHRIESDNPANAKQLDEIVKKAHDIVKRLKLDLGKSYIKEFKLKNYVVKQSVRIDLIDYIKDFMPELLNC